ncbi:MAG: MOP flippase family protein [Anaerolineae bacterium]|nr:MOP flippase family protein [Anaerolineae bacterium]
MRAHTPEAGRLSSLARSTARGAIWTGIASLSTSLLRLAILAILARLLAPADFGLLTAATFFIDLSNIIHELGFSAAVIQKQATDDQLLSTAFWSSLGMGVGLWLVLTAASPLVAWFYRNPTVQPVLMVLATTFVIMPLGLLQKVLLQKELDFRRLALAEVGAVLAMGALSIGLAWQGLGVWSLVWGSIAQRVAEVVLLWLLHPWRPSRAWSGAAFGELFGFGANVVGERIANYLNNNLDYLLVGRLLGEAALGYYSFAFQLVMLPLTRVSILISRVTFPAFSLVQDEEERLQRGYLTTVRYIALLTFPLIVGLFWTAPELLRLIGGGPKWDPALLPLRIMCPAGMIKAVVSTVGSILKARGRPDIGFRWNAATLVVTAGALLIGARFGIVGVAWAVTLLSLLLAPIIQAIANRLIGLSWPRYGRALRPALLGSAAICASVGLLRLLNTWALGWSPLPLLVVSILCGGGAYLVAMQFSGALSEARILTRHLFHVRRSAFDVAAERRTASPEQETAPPGL